MYGKVPEIKAIHAGLETGIIAGVYPNLDMISFGPTIRFPHSPDEKVNIPGCKFYISSRVQMRRYKPPRREGLEEPNL